MTHLRYERLVPSDPIGFPWSALPRLDANDVRLERDARHGIVALVDFSRLADVASSLFVATLEQAAVRSTSVTAERRDLGSQFVLRGDGLTVWLSLEPAIITLLLKRVLGQKAELDGGGSLSDAMTGAWLSVLAEVSRRLAGSSALKPEFSLLQASPGKQSLILSPGAQRAWGVDFVVRLDGQSFTGFAAISGAVKTREKSWRRTPSGPFLTPIALRLVVSRCELDRSEFDSLMLGDVLIPGEPVFSVLMQSSVNPNLPNGSRAVLCSPGATRALALEVQSEKLFLAGVTELRYDAAVSNNRVASNQASPHQIPESDAQPTALDVVMDAPVVVHIELGTVTLPAHGWLGLRLGDVVTSQLPIGQPVTLRVAEQAVAEGELVSVDGQVGVRILRFHGA